MDNQKHHLYLRGNVAVVMMEWLPIGRHSMKFLQDKLECEKGFHDFFVSSRIDHERNAATVDVDQAEVMFRIENYVPLEELQFAAKINFAETGGHQQEEFLGIHVSRDGKISYGLQLVPEGEPYSLDDISHIMADLIEDSSRVMDTILNSYQKRLLDIVYCEQSSQRDKFVILIARQFEPGIRDPRDLWDNPAYKSEMRQLLGDPYLDQYCTTPDGSHFIVGENGILLLSEHPERYRDLLRLYGLMGCVIKLQNNIFNRLSWSWDQLYAQKRLVETEDIERIMDVQTALSNLSADQGMLSSVPDYQSKTIEETSRRVAALSQGPQADLATLPFFPAMKRIFDCCGERILEAERALLALHQEIDNVRALASTLSEKQNFGINRAMNILTVVSVIVLPLTLITGIYGMNFTRYSPDGQLVSSWNMPELYMKHGYPMVIVIMLIIAISLYTLFRRKGLLMRGPRKK